VVGVTLILASGTLALAAACAGSRDSDPCMPTAPGTVVYRPGIDVVVRDASGRGAAIGDTSITYRGADSVLAFGFDTLHLPAGFVVPGTYSVRVKRPYYNDGVVPSVTVTADQCGGPVTQQVTVTLQLEPGAPSLRSIAILGDAFLPSPGAKTQLVTRFDRRSVGADDGQLAAVGQQCGDDRCVGTAYGEVHDEDRGGYGDGGRRRRYDGQGACALPGGEPVELFLS
jgi:hypothetical protein